MRFTRPRARATLHKLPQRTQSVIVVLIFVVIGCSLLLATRAAVLSIISVEPEKGDITASATIVDDLDASGGQTVRFNGQTAGLESIPADCSANVTVQLNTFFAAQPNGAVITFPANACYIVNGTVQLVDRQNVTINGNGSTFKAVQVAADYTNRAQLLLLGGSGITVRNLTLQGVNTQASFDGKHEWDHNLAIKGTQNVLLDGIHGRNAFGDFIDIAPDTRRVTNSDGTGGILAKGVTIQNSDMDISGRNGVSCTGCEDITVRNNTFSRIGYQGIDVEIEASKWYGRNIKVIDNTFSGGVQLSMFNASATGSDTTDITVSGNVMTATVKTCQPAIHLDAGAPRRNITISNNKLLAIGTSMHVERGTNVSIRGNTAKITDGGCTGGVRGIYAANTNGITVTGNDFAGSAAGIKLYTVQQPITNYVVCGNRLVASGAFDQPVLCASP